MQKLFFYFVLISVSWWGLASCTSISGKNNTPEELSEIPALLDNPVTSGTDAEWEEIFLSYDKAVKALMVNPNDWQQYIVLAQVFSTEARLSGNTGYYNEAAISMLNRVLEGQNEDKDIRFEALTIKSGVLLSMHQFQDALKTATEAYGISSHNAQLIGALVDANVELGNYEEAVKYCDMMVQLRPDIRSYSRISYLRQIHGDNAGAIEAMKLAVEAGLPGAEPTEWARVILGDLLLMTGDYANAELCYTTADGLRADYAYAKAGLGRLEKAKGNYDAAIKHTEDAIRLISDVAFVNQLADIYALKGDQKKAAEVRSDVLDLLKKSEKESAKSIAPHNGARELSVAYLQNGSYKEAYQLAKKDLATRPHNIDANELAAWIAFKSGDYAAAKSYADEMLHTNVNNPVTLYKAGKIYKQAGQTAKGDKCLEEATAMQKNIVAQVNSYISE